MDEYIDILNKDGSSTGKSCPKSEIHSKGHYHNTVHIWFYSTDGRILLAQRAASKTIYPLLWDVSVAGHVDAGETTEQAAIRETKEEIGLSINKNELQKIGVFESFQSYDNGIIDNEFNHTYISETCIFLKNIIPNTDEVEAVKYVSIYDFYDLLENSETNGHFVSSNRAYYEFVVEMILNELT